MSTTHINNLQNI